MGFRRQDLEVAFSVPGIDSFTGWGYGMTDTLGEILARHCLDAAGALVELADLIYVRIRPRRHPGGGRGVGEVRTALVMVSDIERGRPSIRAWSRTSARLTARDAWLPAVPRRLPSGTEKRRNRSSGDAVVPLAGARAAIISGRECGPNRRRPTG